MQYYPTLPRSTCSRPIRKSPVHTRQKEERRKRAENIHNKLTSTGKCDGCTRLAAMQKNTLTVTYGSGYAGVGMLQRTRYK